MINEIRDLKSRELTNGILHCFFDVYNQLGYGFLEKIYENAMVIELTKSQYNVTQQYPIKVMFRNYVVGEYFADLVINQQVILEIKAAEAISKVYEAQLTNYLRSTNIEVGLLLNFGPRPKFVRKIFTNDRKNRTRI